MTAHDGLPQHGDVLAGKYQVEEVLGTGGMGVVVAARHVALRQRVALKFLLPAAVKLPGAPARFLREAQAAAALQGEHVARVLDVGTLEGGAPYLVLEHLAGVDLARYLKQHGPLPVADAVSFLLQVCEALAEAHALGIVHRDLKPSNLFITRRPDGSPLVKVLDFGLSKMALADDEAGDSSLTATDIVAGSPHYMSPEQIRSLKHVDARTDVWSLGVILYEMLAGARPFVGPSATAVCAGVIADTPAPIRSRRPDVPEGIDLLVYACLQKDARHRVPSVARLAAGLAPFAPRSSEASLERIHRMAPGGARVSGPGSGPASMPGVSSSPPSSASSGQGARGSSSDLLFGRAPLASAPLAAPPPPQVAVAPFPGQPSSAQPAPVAPSLAAPSFGLVAPPAPPRAPLPSRQEAHGAAAFATGSVGWGNTQPPRRGLRGPLVAAFVVVGVLVAAPLVWLLTSRADTAPPPAGAAGPPAGSNAPQGASSASAAPSAAPAPDPDPAPSAAPAPDPDSAPSAAPSASAAPAPQDEPTLAPTSSPPSAAPSAASPRPGNSPQGASKPSPTAAPPRPKVNPLDQY